MRCVDPSASVVTATVDEVLPLTGLAYLTDDRQRGWTVTKSTPGMGLGTLVPGQKMQLRIERHGHFALVREYRPAR